MTKRLSHLSVRARERKHTHTHKISHRFPFQVNVSSRVLMCVASANDDFNRKMVVSVERAGASIYQPHELYAPHLFAHIRCVCYSFLLFASFSHAWYSINTVEECRKKRSYKNEQKNKNRS